MSGGGGSLARIDLRHLRAERGAVVAVACHETVASRIEEMPFEEPVEGTLTLINLGPVLRVEGRLQTRVDLTCDLCTTRFPYRLETAVEEELAWDSPSEGRAGAATDGGEFLTHVGESIFFNIEALAREMLVLALPMVARCSPDCRGLCPRCGADLRRTPCRCAAEAGDGIADPRLRPLLAWRQDRPSSGSAL